MSKYYNFAIVISFFCLWLISFISVNTEVFIGFSMIFSFGILHGANDLKLIQHIQSKQNKISIKKVLIYYLLIVLAGIIAFYYLPLLALIIFIIISGYHFGEQQWQYLAGLNKKWFSISLQTIYGMFILFLLFNFHQIEVQKIIFEIATFIIPIHLFSISLKVIGIVLLAHLLYLYIYEENLRSQIVLEVFYLLVFTVIFLSSSLIWGFAIFFIIWHSIPSMMNQMEFLYKKVDFNNFKLYFKSAFIYWIASLFGIAMLYFMFEKEKIFNALFFSFLAAITFPHALVILKMFGRRRQ